MLSLVAGFLSARANWIEASPLSSIVSRIAELASHGVRVYSLAAGDPDPSLIPREELAEIAAYVLREYPGSVLYTPTAGIAELRKELSKLMERLDGFRAEPSEVIVTSGSTIAIDLVARVVLDPGDIVVTENPTYINSLYAFRQHGAIAVGVRIDDDGMRTDLLEDLLRRLSNEGKKVKMIYTIPTGQNPSGTTLSEDRRKHLLELASQYDLLVLEDGAYNYLAFEQPPPTLKSMDKEGRVVFVGTLSKVLGTGFRVGWVVAPEEVSRKILEEKQPIDFCAPAISQYIALEYLRRGLLDKHHPRALEAYREKRDVLLRALDEKLPGLEHTRPKAGMFVMLYLPEGVDGERFAEKLLEEYHVAVVPGKPFHTDASGANTLRLNYSRPSREEIEEAVTRIAEAFRETARP